MEKLVATASMPHSELLQLVREVVRKGLTRNKGYEKMTPARQRALAHDTVKAFAFILGGADGTSQPRSVPHAV